MTLNAGIVRILLDAFKMGEAKRRPRLQEQWWSSQEVKVSERLLEIGQTHSCIKSIGWSLSIPVHLHRASWEEATHDYFRTFEA